MCANVSDAPVKEGVESQREMKMSISVRAEKGIPV